MEDSGLASHFGAVRTGRIITYGLGSDLGRGMELTNIIGVLIVLIVERSLLGMPWKWPQMTPTTSLVLNER